MKKIFLILLFFSVSELFAQNGWQQITIPTNTSYTFKTIFFVSKDIGFLYYKQISAPYFRDGRVYMTTNGGNTFSLTSTNVILQYAYFKNANTGWILGDRINYEVPGHYYFTYQTTNGGANWIETEYVSNSNYTTCIKFANQNTGWKTLNNGGLYKTTNGGTSWDSVSTFIGIAVDYFTINPIDTINSVYRLTAFNPTGAIRYSTNSGLNWAASTTGAAIQSKRHYEFIDGICFLATSSVYKTTNYGVNWASFSSVPGIRDISVINNQYVWTTDLSGNVKFSSNGGASFNVQLLAGGSNDSSSIFMFPADSVNHTTGYVNLAGQLYKTTTGGIPVTSIGNNTEIIPENFGLTVYPNPFNPSSKIKIENRYFIHSLNISLYDLTGKLIRITGYKNIVAGVNEFNIDYSGLPTGSYLLNISDGKISETKKIVLIK